MQSLEALSRVFWEIWPHLFGAAYFLLAVIAAVHAILNKKDTRAAIGWIGVILMVPVAGALLYAWLGINRLQRKAINLRVGRPQPAAPDYRATVTADDLKRVLTPAAEHLTCLERLISAVTHRPLLRGNRVTQLENGDQAYPQMLAAIDEAQQSVALATYIFDNDRAGLMFAKALGRAVKRGIEVRVIIDAVGSRYSFPSIVGRLVELGVRVQRFLPTMVPWRFAYSNLRSHRKILVVDGRLGFTGGLNIREGHDLSLKPAHPIIDHHFRLEGPVVAQLQEVFAEDWAFCCGEVLSGEKWFPRLEQAGEALARGITAGPDGDLDKRRLTLEGALASAQRSVCIVTPYFLPEGPLIAALNVAAPARSRSRHHPARGQ